jgi:hypothetical protein
MNKGSGLVGFRRSPDQKRYGALCYAGFDPIRTSGATLCCDALHR